MTLVAMIFCFWVVDIKEAWALRHSCDVRFLVIVALVLIPFCLAVKIMKWQLMLRRLGFKVSYRQTATSYLLGYLVGVATPARLGELARLIGVDGKKGDLLALIVIDRGIDFYVVLMLSTVSAIHLWVGMWAVTFLCVIALLFIYSYIWHFLSFLGRLIHKKSEAPINVVSILRQFDPLFLANQLILTVIVFVVTIFQFCIVTMSFGYFEWRLVWFVPIALLANAVPITVGGFGTREGLLLLLTKDLGIPDEVIVNASVLWIAITIFVVWILWFGLERGWNRSRSD